MLLSIFLVALDQTITATAIPRIASDFNSLDSITWIASGYFLTQAGFLLLYGQLLIIAPTKWVYITAITIFELGSLICGVSPNVNVLIFGRAFAGVGAAG
jgi:MFS family permease